MEKGKGRPKKLKGCDIDVKESITINTNGDDNDIMGEYRMSEFKKSENVRGCVTDRLKVTEGDQVKVLLACAWASDANLKHWHLFPEALSMDTTSK